MFNIGDRVVYTGLHNEYHIREKIGCQGTVGRGRSGYMAFVVWDNKDWPANECYLGNIALVAQPADETEAFFV